MAAPLSAQSLLAREVPLWRQWWAFLIYAALSVLLFIVMRRVREARLIRIQNERLAEAKEELEELSMQDPLTELYNRRYLDNRLEEELAHARRSDTPLSVLMFDLDHFKQYNDTYGHVAGDKILVAFASILRKEIHRKTDFACRYGGEEFAALLFDTDESGARSLAEQIIEAVRDTGVTVSVGVATAGPGETMTGEQILSIADQALYRAKEDGRDRLAVAR